MYIIKINRSDFMRNCKFE